MKVVRIGLDIAKSTGRLSGTAQAWRYRARSMEHQQIGPWPMAAVQDAGIGFRVTITLFQ